MRQFLYIFLVISLISCSTSQDSIDVVESTTSSTTVADTSSDNSSTTTVDENDDNLDDSTFDSYKYDSDKMSPFTGLELPPEIWLQRPKRVLAFKIDNNLNARPQ